MSQSVQVYERSDATDAPVTANVPICSSCENTDFPENNVEWLQYEMPTALHVCTECGAFSATLVPEKDVPDDADVRFDE